MASKNLIETINIKCFPNSYFKWYEIKTWTGKVSYEYDLILKNRKFGVWAPLPVTEKLRSRIKGVIQLIDDKYLGEIQDSCKSLLYNPKIQEYLSLFNHLDLIENLYFDGKYNKKLKFELVHDGIMHSINNSPKFHLYEAQIWDENIWYKYMLQGESSMRNNSLKLSYSQLSTLIKLLRASLLCSIEYIDFGYGFGRIEFSTVNNLIERSLKHGFIKIVPDYKF